MHKVTLRGGVLPLLLSEVPLPIHLRWNWASHSLRPTLGALFSEQPPCPTSLLLGGLSLCIPEE